MDEPNTNNWDITLLTSGDPISASFGEGVTEAGWRGEDSTTTLYKVLDRISPNFLNGLSLAPVWIDDLDAVANIQHFSIEAIWEVDEIGEGYATFKTGVAEKVKILDEIPLPHLASRDVYPRPGDLYRMSLCKEDMGEVFTDVRDRRSWVGMIGSPRGERNHLTITLHVREPP